MASGSGRTGSKVKGTTAALSRRQSRSAEALPNGAKSLDSDLIRRADSASNFYDKGQATQREYTSNVNEISGMEYLTADEKKDAYSRLHSLTETQLKREAESVSWATSGRGNLNVSQTQRKGALEDKARADTRSFMDGIRETNKKRGQKAENNRFQSAALAALNSGALEFTYGGKTWVRKSTRSKSFSAK